MTQLPLRMVPGDMDRVERRLQAAVESDDRRLSAIIGHLVEAGGKRLRPVLTLSAAYSVQEGGSDAPVDDRVVVGAAASELMHLGSLYHDDVIDEADTRRGVSSVNVRWDNTTAVLSGDVLLAKASGLAASLGSHEAEIVAETLIEMCVGQMRESFTLFDPGRDEHEYLACVRGKTAALMETSCRLGALEGRAGSECVEALAHYGRAMGVAFQIVDDVRDVRGDANAAGSDLAEGVYTLPVIYARDRTPGLTDLLGDRKDPEALAQARQLVLDSGGVEASLHVAGKYLARARTVLNGAPDLHPDVRAQLLELAEWVVSLGGAARIDDQPVLTPSAGDAA